MTEEQTKKPVGLDVEILAQALHAQYRLQRPGSKPMSDSVVHAMASFIASQYERIAAEKAIEPDR